MNRFVGSLSLACVVVVACAAPAFAQFTLLHSFTRSATDGAYPEGSLMLSGSTLYGMTGNGGATDGGMMFKIGADGTGFSSLHSFVGGATDGRRPSGTPVQSGSTLYGMTNSGGSNNRGTIFKIGADGTGFSLLHSFAGGTADGGAPLGSLTLSGSDLYGMTRGGGSDSRGTIFRIGTDGTGFSLLHSFTGSAADGADPLFSSLIHSGSTLYGMTEHGGSLGGGTIFKIGTDGTGFSLLHSFVFGADDGALPTASLVQSGSTLYGMTPRGGSNDNGTIFKIGTDGTGFGLLHSFLSGAADGDFPDGSLIVSGSTLYGMSEFGGSSDAGTIFQIGTDGTGFGLLYSFAGGASDGELPIGGDLIQSGSTLYGMTFLGGTEDAGTIFGLEVPLVPEPRTFLLAIVGGAYILSRRRNGMGS
jgi:uncharacterized repeat protein (TIGR03803 family)